MADANYTALHIVLDRSGSMSGIRDDMVGALEHMLREQAGQPGMLTIDVVTFDDEVEHTHAWAAAEDVRIELVPRGGTALYDAVGMAVNGFDQRIEALPQHARPAVVQVVIVTDGFDNRSREYTSDIVKSLVTRQQAKGWEFVFLGAEQDAVLAAEQFGIGADRAMTFARGGHSVGATFTATSHLLAQTRRREQAGFTKADRDAAAGSTSTTPGAS